METQASSTSIGTAAAIETGRLLQEFASTVTGRRCSSSLVGAGTPGIGSSKLIACSVATKVCHMPQICGTSHRAESFFWRSQARRDGCISGFFPGFQFIERPTQRRRLRIGKVGVHGRSEAPRASAVCSRVNRDVRSRLPFAQDSAAYDSGASLPAGRRRVEEWAKT
jgi:hypothetical protein